MLPPASTNACHATPCMLPFCRRYAGARALSTTGDAFSSPAPVPQQRCSTASLLPCRGCAGARMLTNIGDADQLEGLGDLRKKDQASCTAAVPCHALLGSSGRPAASGQPEAAGQVALCWGERWLRSQHRAESLRISTGAC